jgi:hypothetical protein
MGAPGCALVCVSAGVALLDDLTCDADAHNAWFSATSHLADWKPSAAALLPGLATQPAVPLAPWATRCATNLSSFNMPAGGSAAAAGPAAHRGGGGGSGSGSGASKKVVLHRGLAARLSVESAMDHVLHLLASVNKRYMVHMQQQQQQQQQNQQQGMGGAADGDTDMQVAG